MKMKAAKSIVLLLALNKLIKRERKILFRRKMKHFLLTFAWFMQKQDYNYCSGYVLQVLLNPKTCRPSIYWMINEQRWFEKWLLERMNQYSRSFRRTEAATSSVLLKKVFFRNFTKFTGKRLCQSLFFNKVAGLALSLQLYLKGDSGRSVFLWILQIF